MLNKQSNNYESFKYFNESLSCLQQPCISEKYVLWLQLCLLHQCHCLKGFRICSFSGPYFPVFGLNTKIYSVNSVFSPNAGKCGSQKLLTGTLFMQSVSLCWKCKHIDPIQTNSSFNFIWIEISKTRHEALIMT